MSSSNAASGSAASGQGAVHVVVLAGGSGTRFWPASRARRPKQLLALGTDKPLIVETIERIMPIAGDWAHVYVASGVRVADATRALLRDLPESNLLVEPAARNTAPCIGWAAATIARADPDAVLVVLPSDHHILRNDAYLAALDAAIAEARRGVVTTIGIRPTRPETGFGYIEVAEPIETGKEHHAVRPVVRFVEKPDRARAEGFLAGGKHLWNAGMFVFRARDMLAAIDTHAPALGEALRAFDEAAKRGDEARVVGDVFPGLSSVSIDYAIMEKLERLSVVPADIGWSDVGSFEAAYELAEKDARGNAAPAGSLLIDADGCLVIDMRTHKHDRVVGLVGVKDLVTVVTDDAVLVMPRERAQDAKLLPQALTEAERTGLV